MSTPFPKKDDYSDEEQWNKDVSQWMEDYIKDPPSDPDHPIRRALSFTDEEISSTDNSSSSEEELEPGQAARIIDQQERVIVQQIFDSIEKEQEMERLKKELGKEKEARKEVEKRLEAMKRNNQRAGPSRRY